MRYDPTHVLDPAIRTVRGDALNPGDEVRFIPRNLSLRGLLRTKKKWRELASQVEFIE